MLLSENYSKFKENILTFCKHTSLHGFVYVTTEKYTILKIFWLMTCTICLAFGSHLMYVQVERFDADLTRTSLKTDIYPVWRSPFPAVTICNYNAVHAEKSQQFSNIFSNLNYTDEEINYFFIALNRLKSYSDSTTTDERIKFEKMLDILRDSNNNIDILMQSLAHSCETMLKKCVWLSMEYECTQLFKMVKTTRGHCCSFNYHGSLDDKYENVFYVPGAGTKFGLSVEIDIEESKYINENDSRKAGVQVMVHSSFAFPDLFLFSYLMKTMSFVTLSTSSTTLISRDIRQIDVTQRMCYMEDENFLQSINIYNFETCIIECKMKYVQQLCGCTPYYSPIKINETCTFKHRQCLSDNEATFANIALRNSESDEEDKLFHERLSDRALGCFCLPNCNEVTYNTMIEDNKFEDLENSSILNVYYNSISMQMIERESAITWDVLLASCGGIFSLSLGGSVFSVMEIIFYLFRHVFDGLIKKIDGKLFKKRPMNKVENVNSLFFVYRSNEFYN